MKKLIVIFAAAFVMMNAKGQVILSEDFEGANFPPTNWTQYDLAGGDQWGKDYSVIIVYYQQNMAMVIAILMR